MISILSDSENRTFEIGFAIGSNVSCGDIILLYGDLGAGKTVLAKGIAKGAGVEEIVTSPTFSLMNEYKGKCPVYHFDMYRLSNAHELYDLDYEEYFYGDGITIVEWPERLADMLPDSYIKVIFTKTREDSIRKLDVSFVGNQKRELKGVLKNYESPVR